MSGALAHRMATTGDVAELARMNQQLIADEAHRNPMTLLELASRMRDMLDGDYTVTIFERDGRVIAYALWCDEPEHVYLRQFFVARGRRREGIGRQAIRLLIDDIWPRDKRVRVNVLIGNQPALAFWRAVGFEDYLITLEMERKSE